MDTPKAVADALAQERKRLQEMDEIADMVPDKTLLKEAKYGSNLMTAQELSYRFLKQSQKAGAQFLNAWETEDSGAEKVQSLPTENVQATKELSAKAKEEALFKESLARFLKERGSN